MRHWIVLPGGILQEVESAEWTLWYAANGLVSFEEVRAHTLD